jgi:hypothetical protein
MLDQSTIAQIMAALADTPEFVFLRKRMTAVEKPRLDLPVPAQEKHMARYANSAELDRYEQRRAGIAVIIHGRELARGRNLSWSECEALATAQCGRPPAPEKYTQDAVDREAAAIHAQAKRRGHFMSFAEAQLIAKQRLGDVAADVTAGPVPERYAHVGQQVDRERYAEKVSQLAVKIHGENLAARRHSDFTNCEEEAKKRIAAGAA